MASVNQLTAPRLLAYGSLRLPLALLELPLFVLLPNYYSERLGVELATVGTALFVTRLFDALLDPLIGDAIDRSRGRFHFRHWIWCSLPVMAIGFFCLMHPPRDQGSVALTAWLAIMSLVTYVGYSIASIAYQAWGASIAHDDVQRARVTGFREALGLFGVITAAIWLTPDHVSMLTTLFIAFALASAFCIRFAPRGPEAKIDQSSSGVFRRVTAALRNRQFRWLIAALIINGVATAIPATLVLFYVSDVLESPASAPLFLIIYFLAGALGMPAWIAMSASLGLKRTWLVGLAVAIFAFVWTLSLGAGDTTSFAVICLLTGLALGADLAMPPAMLASVIAANGDAGKNEGAYFGVWNFVIKLNLAGAAGIALPLLAALGYQPGVKNALSLILVYAALPCVMKLLTGIVLLLAPLPENPERQANLV